MKKALITGVTGQDGSYLSEFLLEKGYEVHGIKRRASSFNTARIDHIYEDRNVDCAQFRLHYGDLTDTSNLTRLISEIEPDEIYNLGAQSHVAVSFEAPEYTADVDAIGTLRLLEAIRFLGLEKNRVFTRPRLQSYMVWYRKYRRKKPRRFIRALHTQRQKCMHTGLPSIIGKRMGCMHAMAYCLITSHRDEGRPL